jgi:hypothetical protein
MGSLVERSVAACSSSISGEVIAPEPTKSGHEKHEGIVNSTCSRAERGHIVGPR